MDKLLENYYRITNAPMNVEGLRQAFIEVYGYDPVQPETCAHCENNDANEDYGTFCSEDCLNRNELDLCT